MRHNAWCSNSNQANSYPADQQDMAVVYSDYLHLFSRLAYLVSCNATALKQAQSPPEFTLQLRPHTAGWFGGVQGIIIEVCV